MSREDWEDWEAYREHKRRTKEQRRAVFSAWFDEHKPKGWKRHHDTHYSCMLLGDQLDYWPGPMKWRWRGKTMSGQVGKFIAARIKEHESRNRIGASWDGEDYDVIEDC